MWFWIPSNFCVFGLRESGFSGPKLYYATSVAWLSLRPLEPGQLLGFMGGVQEHLYFVYYAPSLSHGNATFIVVKIYWFVLPLFFG